ncbi:hypothetical protein ACN9MB_13055 [Dyella kyungheensis]|uniref:hypothetical protein n=1 Tax=Dyella kyungheensis TaxID=1242174 RepID=UPI003CF5BE5E
MSDETELPPIDTENDGENEPEVEKAPAPTPTPAPRGAKKYEGLVLLVKDGHKLHVHPNHVDEHASLGWKKPEA